MYNAEKLLYLLTLLYLLLQSRLSWLKCKVVFSYLSHQILLYSKFATIKKDRNVSALCLKCILLINLLIYLFKSLLFSGAVGRSHHNTHYTLTPLIFCSLSHSLKSSNGTWITLWHLHCISGANDSLLRAMHIHAHTKENSHTQRHKLRLNDSVNGAHLRAFPIWSFSPQARTFITPATTDWDCTQH